MSPPLSATDRIGWAALLGGSLIICFSAVFMRMADIGPLAAAAWRMTLALPVLAIWTLAAGRAGDSPRPPANRMKGLIYVVLAGIGFTLDVACFQTAIGMTTIANAMFISNISPILVVIAGRVFFGETVRRAVWVALVLSLVGSWIMSGFATPASFSAGDLLALMAGVAYAGYMLATKLARRWFDGSTTTLMSAGVGAVLVWAMALTTEPHLVPLSAYGWLAVILMGVVSHAGGQGLTSVALGRLPVGPIALVVLALPPVSALVAWLILGEAMNTHQLAGGALILTGLALARPR